MKAHPRFVASFVAARKALELNQSSVAERMRIRLKSRWTTGTVSNFEAGMRAVNLTEAENLAAIVCVPLDRMLTESASEVARIARTNMRTGVSR